MATIIKIDSVESTNKHCKLLDLNSVEKFTVYWTPCQTAGVGQRGSQWVSEPNKNLTMSIVLHPTILKADEQFGLTMAVSLAIKDYLISQNRNGAPIGIKWPNDIYVGQSKICGTLIENTLNNHGIATSVCGIGLNVNQTIFPDWLPNPTSMAAEWSEEYDIENSVLPNLINHITHYYNLLKHNGRKSIEPQYLDNLVNYRRTAHYRYEGNDIEAAITGIDQYGRLMLKQTDGTQIVSEVKEIAFLDIICRDKTTK